MKAAAAGASSSAKSSTAFQQSPKALALHPHTSHDDCGVGEQRDLSLVGPPRAAVRHRHSTKLYRGCMMPRGRRRSLAQWDIYGVVEVVLAACVCRALCIVLGGQMS